MAFLYLDLIGILMWQDIYHAYSSCCYDIAWAICIYIQFIWKESSRLMINLSYGPWHKHCVCVYIHTYIHIHVTYILGKTSR